MQLEVIMSPIILSNSFGSETDTIEHILIFIISTHMKRSICIDVHKKSIRT